MFQPRLSISRQRITGVEALLRWDSREFGMVSPAQFIPLAEESGMSLELGAWALRNACMTLREWHDAGLEELSVAVNVSATQLQRGDLQTVVARALEETGVPASRLELELTESVVMASPEQNADTPVSYTHLDVYKRQVPGRPWPGRVGGRPPPRRRYREGRA